MTDVASRALIMLIDGVALSEALPGQLRTVRVAARLNRPTQCEAVLTTAPGPAALTGPVRLGASLQIRLDGHPETLFSGEVTAVEVEYHPDGGATLRVRGYDLLHRLRKRQRLRVFESVTAADLAGELCADLGLRVEAESEGPRLERLTHHHANDLDLLLAVAGRAGLHLTVHEGVLHLVTLRGQGEPVPLALGHRVHDLRLSVNADTAAGESTALGWHPQRAEPIAQSTATPRCGRRTPVEPDPAVVGAEGARTALDQPGRSDDEIAALAQARLDLRAAALVTAEGTAEGDPALRPGRRVLLAGVAEAVAGSYVLTEVVHTLDADGHLTRFSTAPPPPPPAGPPAPAVVTLGTVTDVADPAGLGRVRVELPAYGGADAGWLGVLCPGAGPGKGLVALPDPQDRVLVALPGGEPASGVVLGSLFGAVEPYDTGIDEGRARRWSLRTAGGQQVVIDDVTRSLRLSTEAGSWLELTPELATLHAATDLVLSAPGRAMVVRARSVDFLHAEAVEDPDTAAEQARSLARAHHDGGR